MRPAAFGLLALCGALSAQPASANAAGGHAIDLRRLHLTRDGATAALSDQSSIRLTLDPELQKAAERILTEARPHEGAIVVSNVRTGRILVWATRGAGRDFVASPFAPSASLFKVVTATALLEKGSVTPATRQCYAGGERSIGSADLYDNRSRDSECTTVGEALGHSVNLVFARLALKHLSPPDLRARAALLGFSGEIPIDVPAAPGEVHIPGDPLGMARAAAGFWNGKLSPLGALFAMQTIANGGERIRLSVVDRGEATHRTSAGRAMSESTAQALRRMLEVTTRRGTCARAFHHKDGTRALPHISVAAKTGTLVGGRPSRMYSWFAGFAPSTEPEIAVAVMLGNDVQWWAKANEVARDVLEAYFGRTR